MSFNFKDYILTYLSFYILHWNNLYEFLQESAEIESTSRHKNISMDLSQVYQTARFANEKLADLLSAVLHLNGKIYILPLGYKIQHFSYNSLVCDHWSRITSILWVRLNLARVGIAQIFLDRNVK